MESEENEQLACGKCGTKSVTVRLFDKKCAVCRFQEFYETYDVLGRKDKEYSPNDMMELLGLTYEDMQECSPFTYRILDEVKAGGNPYKAIGELIKASNSLRTKALKEIDKAYDLLNKMRR